MKKKYIRNIIISALLLTGTAVIMPADTVSALTAEQEIKEVDWNETCSPVWFGSDEGIKTGWVKEKGNWYYYNKKGELQTGWIKDDGNTYFTDQDGAMQTGVIQIGDGIYYFNHTGAMQTGKVKIGDTYFKFKRNGTAVAELPVPEKTFDENGKEINKDKPEENKPDADKPQENKPENTEKLPDSGIPKDDNISVEGLPELPEVYKIKIEREAEEKILELMNKKRKEAGIKPLEMDNTLLKVAEYKSDAMIQENFFSHNNPDGTKWSDWLKKAGYKYTTTGENIAYNMTDPVELFTQWWNSEGHRQNMMNPAFGKVGIGVIYGNGKYMGTQIFSN